MKILHIGYDSQFLQFISKIFERVAPGSNHYAIISKKTKEHLTHKITKGQIKIIKPSVVGLFKIALLARKYDALIAHSLTDYSTIAFLGAPRKTVRVWSGWGSDYYPSNICELLGDKTNELFVELKKKSKKKDSIIKLGLRKLSPKLKAICISEIDYFSAPIPNDVSVLKRNYPQFSGEYIQLNYGSVEETFSHGGLSITGKNILLGNSASFENNHLDIFERIKGFVFEEKQVIVPLSYGDENYRDSIIKKGREYLGTSFYPLEKLMSLSEYSQLISSCQIIVMAHKRQQALGNICSAMYKGARIILDEQSPAYQFFIERGAVVNSLQDLSNKSILFPLNESEKSQNRKVLEAFWGDEEVLKNTRKLIEKIQSELITQADNK